jgi:hypothetical protein
MRRAIRGCRRYRSILSCVRDGVLSRAFRLVCVVALLAAATGCESRTFPTPPGAATPSPQYPTPTPTPSDPPSQSAPTGTPTPSLATVTVGEWSATCSSVDLTVCTGVASAALNNLARSRPTGALTVGPRPACPPVPAWADGSRCWQVLVSMGSQAACMVIARRTIDDQYAMVAGDVPGQKSLPGQSPGCP